MSIKLIAIELYRAQQKLEQIQKEMDEASPAEQDRLKHELAAATKECQLMRKMLDGHKDSSPYRQKFAGFTT